MRTLAKAGIAAVAAGMVAGIALSGNASANSTASAGKTVQYRSEQAASMGPTRKTIGYLSKQASPTKIRRQAGLVSISYRELWCGVSGDFQLNLNGLGVYDGQPVAVTVVEAGTGGSEFFGAARMRVNNVRVWDGAVTAWVTVEWGSGLCIWTHYVGV